MHLRHKRANSRGVHVRSYELPTAECLLLSTCCVASLYDRSSLPSLDFRMRRRGSDAAGYK